MPGFGSEAWEAWELSHDPRLVPQAVSTRWARPNRLTTGGTFPNFAFLGLDVADLALGLARELLALEEAVGLDSDQHPIGPFPTHNLGPPLFNQLVGLRTGLDDQVRLARLR